eukprot:TRINITY_DN24236_c0_g1_i1.p1 TRINITY_DN24236_c0_g1~~TRINITY_DN24236_c0_g1_i1.p1  ORF type:complete len:333 (+),score=64.85 TRINITY_DN24236_c0_g1_i1:64-1062(+)
MPAAWAVAAAEELDGSVSVERSEVGVEDCGESSTWPAIKEIPGLRPQLVCPGDAITAEPGALRGKGIVERDDGKLIAAVTGVVEQVNKLIYVRPLKHKYVGNVGDVVVGRVVEVGADRWSLEIGTANHASLHLGAIQLPGNVQRRRTDEDTLRMREFFGEDDLISAEVQRVGESGDVALQTRTARYGKLQNGVLALIPSIYVRRQAQHFVTLPAPIGVLVVLGNNGHIWISAPPKVAGAAHKETLNFSQMDQQYELVTEELRERICRVRNCVMFLAQHGLEVTPEAITFSYEQSVLLKLAAWELLDAVRCDDCGLTAKVVDEAVSSSAPDQN